MVQLMAATAGPFGRQNMRTARYLLGLPILFLGLGLIYVSVMISGDPFETGDATAD